MIQPIDRQIVFNKAAPPGPLFIFGPLFFCTMVGIGAVLNFADFMPVLRKPQWVALGIAAQFTIMPALAFYGCVEIERKLGWG